MKMIELKKLMFKYKKEAPNKAYALMMLIDTIQKLAKEKKKSEDEMIVEGTKKYVKQLEDSMQNGMDVKDELDFILSLNFLPKIKSKDEMKIIIQNILSSNEFTLPKDFGKIMGQLKKLNDGTFDMKVASQILKEI